jgi:hypothetical protein
MGRESVVVRVPDEALAMALAMALAQADWARDTSQETASSRRG